MYDESLGKHYCRNVRHQLIAWQLFIDVIHLYFGKFEFSDVWQQHFTTDVYRVQSLDISTFEF